MKITTFARPTLIAGALFIGGAAHAETADQVIDTWATYMARSVDRLTGEQRDKYMKTLTKEAQDALSKVACKTEEDAQRTSARVKTAQDSNKLPVKTSYKPSCDLKAQRMKVEFTITEFLKEGAQDGKDDGANLGKLKSAIAAWGAAAKKSVDDTHEPQKTKNEVDAATATAARALADIACRHTSEASIEDLVAKEISSRGLKIDHHASGECDAQRHKWKITFTVASVAIPFSANKDGGGVDPYKKRLVDVTVETMFNDVKTWTRSDKVPIALDKQRTEFAARIAFHTSNLNKMTCKPDPSDKLASYLQEEITQKAGAAREYISPQKIDVRCDSGGHLAVVVDALPVIKLPPTIPANANAKAR